MSDIQHYFEVCGYQPDDLINIGTQGASGPPRFSFYPVSDAERQIKNRPKTANVWIGACPTTIPTDREDGKPSRGTAEDIVRVDSLWADLDVKENGVASMEEAQAVIDDVSMLIHARPVAVVMSGHGLQPRWRLDEPLINDHPTTAQIVKDFGRLVAVVVERRGGKVDSVHDLARILRAPGSVNNKDVPVPVTVEFPSNDMVEMWQLQDAFDDYLPVPLPTEPVQRAENVDLTRGDRYATKVLNYELESLISSAEMAPGVTDSRGRGWEKIQADAALHLASLVKADWNSLTEEHVHQAFLEAAPTGDGWSTEDVERKWTQQWARAEAKEPPVEKVTQSDDPLDDNYVAPMPVVREDGGASSDAPRSSSAWPRLAQTDKGYATRIVMRYGDVLRYSPKLELWLRYVDGRWIDDKDGGTWAAHQLTDELYELEAGQYDDTEEYKIGNRVTTERKEFGRWVGGQESTARVKAAAEMLKASHKLHVELSEFDASHTELNTRTCAVNLEDGSVIEHSPSLMMRRMTAVAYDPDAKCPEWEAFLAQALPNEEVRDFLHRVVGYSLTGSTSAQKIFIHRGVTSSGKSVFLRVFAAVLGEYARPMPESLLLNKGFEAHPTGISGLEGCRVIYCDETPEGARWDEAVLKRLTGETPITARGMHQDFRDFRLTGKAHVITNFPPHLSDDPAVHRRLVVMPWDVSVPEEQKDEHLADRMIANELPGILAWAVRGTQRWLEDGLREPADVELAKAKYIESEDEFGEWMRENTLPTGDGGFITPTKLIYQDYRNWTLARGGSPMRMTPFGVRLGQRGAVAARTNKVRGWRLALQQSVDVLDS